MSDPTSFEDCRKIWFESRKRKLGNNTYLIHEVGKIPEAKSEYFGIKLHKTVIVKYYANEKLNGSRLIELDTGGWYTVTTKDRINRFSPARVGSDKGIWYVYTGDNKYEFEDGMVVDENGVPVDREPFVNNGALKRKLDKMVNEYIKGYLTSLVEKREFTTPTKGDCWGCIMRPVSEKKYDPRIQPMGFDHYIEHFKEKYYVPTIAFQAISRRGNPGFIYQMEAARIAKGEWPTWLEQDMKYMFRSIKVNLLKELK